MNRTIRYTSSVTELSAVVLVMTIITLVGTVNFDATYAQQISPEQKAKMCNPNNPRLNFVNSTESKICGIPESVKNQTTTATNNSSTTIAPQITTPSVRPPL